MRKNLSELIKTIILIGLIFNILLFAIALILLIKGDFFGQTSWMILYNVLSFPVFLYWLFLLRWWYLNDKNIKSFLGLFFLFGFYTIYYGFKILKKGFEEKPD